MSLTFSSTSTTKAIDDALAKGPEAGPQAMELWMLQCSGTRSMEFASNTRTAANINAALGRILAAGVGPDDGKSNTTALCVSAMKNNLKGMEMLLAAGASVGRVGAAPPLVVAISHCRDEATRLLLDKADPLLPNSSGITPAAMAMRTSNAQILEELLARGATLNPASPDHVHPVSEIVSFWKEENMPERMRASSLSSVLDLPVCDLDVDAPCSGEPAHAAIIRLLPEAGPVLVARARQNWLAKRVNAPTHSPATPNKRI